MRLERDDGLHLGHEWRRKFRGSPPIDITTGGGLTSLTNGLSAGALVKVYGVPQSNGTLQAYVLAYYTGTVMPSASSCPE